MALRRVNGCHGTVPGTCGVGYVSGFTYHNPREIASDWWLGPTNRVESRNIGGSGWLMAGFINNTTSRDAYYRLCNRWGQPVFQSPVRRNVNSQNDFFFCIFDTVKKRP